VRLHILDIITSHSACRTSLRGLDDLLLAHSIAIHAFTTYHHKPHAKHFLTVATQITTMDQPFVLDLFVGT
jgi:hypothetical protein